MITQSQQPLVDYHKAYEQLDSALNNYHQNLQDTFKNRQTALIKQLKEQATKLKYEITQLRKLTSQQTIQQLIIKKKQQKEAQRLKLQMSWRQLTQKLKKLQQQEKKIQNQNIQSLFDISNLQQKIQQLAKQNYKLQNQVKNMDNQKRNNTFVTQPPKKSYTSPYKFSIDKNAQQIKNNKKQNKQNQVKSRLKQIKTIKQIPEGVLLQFLQRKEVKNQIFYILYS